MRSKKSKIFILILFLFVVIGSITFMWRNVFDSDNKIDYVLNTKAYSYLPKAAQNYVKEIYEETGEIILTEKNKEIDKPYLNPNYVDYMVLSEEEKRNISLVPNTFIIEYSNTQSTNVNLPSSYNLNNVNGKSFVTPMNNQGNLGLCWGFASLEQAESYLMVTKNQTYSDLTEKFSVRQIDYAISLDGIKDYQNEYGVRKLTDGSNYYQASLIMSYGLSMIDDKLMPYNSDKTLRTISEIFNFKNSKYELDSSIMMPVLTSDSTDAVRKNYISSVNENIMKYGGAYVGTGSPDGKCGFKNTDGTYAMVDADNCVGNSGHAMQIIGWDDNYSYSYCRDGVSHLSVNENGECDNGTKVSGKGAWILRNSWGEESEYKYVYMGYSSYGMEIGFTTSLTSMSDRNWDNVYNKGIIGLSFRITTDSTVIYNKKIDTAEKLEKIKFMAYASNGEYTISVESGDKEHANIKTIETDEPGIYTVDLSNLNILLDGSQFKVIIKSNNDTHYVTDSVSVYTSNIDKTPVIKTKDLTVNSVYINEDSNYQYLVYSDTKNIESNSQVDYSLWKDGENYTYYIMSSRSSLVAANNIANSIVLLNAIPVGDYILKTKFSNYEFESKISVAERYTLEGSGTEKDPYLIYNESDLEQIRYDLNANYLLKSDITLTKEWLPIGTKNNPFRGGFDGGNHTISNLSVYEDINDAVGFFGYVEVKYDYATTIPSYQKFHEKTTIKNVIFKNPRVLNKGDAGILIGQILFDPNNTSYMTEPYAYYDGPPILLIDNVHFIGGRVSSSYGNAGVLAAYVKIFAKTMVTPMFNINNIFSSVNISGYSSAGLIGYINDYYLSGDFIATVINMTNIQNVGTLNQSIFGFDYGDGDNYFSPVIGGLYGNIDFDLDNFIINSVFDDPEYNKQFVENNPLFFIGNHNSDDSTDFNFNQFSKSKGYYITKHRRENTKMHYKFFASVDEIKDDSLYESWKEFDTYWKIETIDNIKRIPVLKNINYDYSNISDINIKLYDKVSLLDYISGSSEIQYISYNVISNDKVIEIDELANDYIIDALGKGTAQIHVVNNYDGLSKNITINVTADKVSNPIITFILNLNNNNSYTQSLTALEPFNLMENKFDIPGYKFVGWNTIADGSGEMYSNSEYFEDGIDENLRLYAQWEKDLTYEIIQYSVDEGNKYIDLIEIYTSVDDFKKNITLGTGYTVDVDFKLIEGKNILYTGGKIKIYYGDNLYAEYTNIVRGDANGDGIMNIFDYIRIMKDIMDDTKLNGIYKKAADVTQNGNVDIFDYIRIMKKIMEEE